MAFNPALVTSAFAYEDGFQTTLSNPMTDSQLTAEMASLPAGAEGTLVIEPGTANEEEIYFTSKGTGLVNIPSVSQGRGVNGTAHAHNSGVPVKMLITKASLDSLRGDIVKNGVLGYAEITSNFVTGTTGSEVDVTGLATTVTVPTGGRRIKISVYLPAFYSSNAVGCHVSIAEGATILSQSNLDVATGNKDIPISVSYCAVPSAGSHTYKVTVRSEGATTMICKASARSIAYILVEYLGGV